MRAMYFKEIRSFFSSMIAYVVIGVFLAFLGLILWVFPDTSVLDNNYAQLDPLFAIAPLVFMFLIPALTMRSFAEEYNSGTIELLYTKPLSDAKLVLSKYFAYCTIVFLALLPTLIYYYSIYQLGAPKGNLDSGAIIGSYIGLFCLAAAFVAIGICSSSLTRNQITAFVIGAFFCFFFTWVFEFVSGLSIFYGRVDDIVERLGINFHYSSMSKGVIDSRDVIYFLSISSYFLILTHFIIKSKRS